MLDFLHIRGLALLDDVELELGRGMNVLTGETGAGKSIIVDALGLVRGARGRAELVREGVKLAQVEAQFSLGPAARTRVEAPLAELGLTIDEDQLLMSRSVRRAGRGRAQMQCRIVTRAALEGVGARLIDICSQHEHHSLADVASHVDLLDAYAGLLPKRQAYAQGYREWQQTCMALRDVRAAAGERLRRVDYLRFQLEELEGMEHDFAQADELRERLTLVRDAHQWASFATEAHHVLYEADDALASKLASLAQRARTGPETSASLQEIGEQLEAAVIACDEAARAAGRLGDELRVEPGELDQLAERVHNLDRLERKHGCAAGDLASQLHEMRSELAQLEGADEHESELQARETKLCAVASKGARALSKARVKAAKRLASEIECELAALHMAGAKLEVAVRLRPHGDLGPRGADEVEFMFSANPGEPLAALNKVASGGELSRVLLAVKGVLATGDPVVTYVFDEVDAGVGGAVAEAIGRRLARTAQERQVLCITHLPQIAAFAQNHFRVEKHCVAGRTITRVRRLTDAQRREELARMMAGAKVTASARRHAKDLLEEAAKWRSEQGSTSPPAVLTSASPSSSRKTKAAPAKRVRTKRGAPKATAQKAGRRRAS